MYCRMGRGKGMLSSLQERVNAFFYKCEYLKECDKITLSRSLGSTADFVLRYLQPQGFDEVLEFLA